LSTATNGGAVQWEIGPIVEAWQAGTLTNDGLVLEPLRGGASREVSFYSSDQSTATLRPKLVITYTDQAPAIRSGTAEIQPRIVRINSTNVALTAWLDVDASGSTPTGNATGFDAITITHNGGLQITSVDRLIVGGTSINTSLLSFTDNGTSVTLHVPRGQSVTPVELGCRANVLAAASSDGLDLPMRVDDTATPGCASQTLWPGNGDRVSGNGDDWILSVVNTPPVSIDLTPDT